MTSRDGREFVFAVSDGVLGGKHVFMANLAAAIAENGYSATLVVQKGGQLMNYAANGYIPGVSCVEVELDDDDKAAEQICRYLATVPSGSTVFATGRRDAQVLEDVKGNVTQFVWGAFRHSGFPLNPDSSAQRYYDASVPLVLTSQRLIDNDFAHIPNSRKLLMRSTVPSGWATAVDQARARLPARTSDRINVVYTGRLSWEKGIDRAVTAISEQLRTRDCLELHLCGEGPDEQDLRELARLLGVQSRVHFHPFRADVADYYALADCVVLPSIAGETGPLSLKEAMAAGIAVVASPVGGIGEFIEHGVSGLLVSQDEPLTDALVALAKDLSLRDRLAAGALASSRQFGTWNDAAAELAAWAFGVP